MGNLKAGGSAGKIRFTYDEDGVRRMKQAFQVIPKNGIKNTSQAATASVRGLGNRAEQIFYSNPRRPGESGEGAERGRQTDKFTFGGKDQAGNAFYGGTFKVSEHKFGFGYPDVAHADKATNYVWRSLEYGLLSPHSLFGDGTFFHLSESKHNLPNKYFFTTTAPSTSSLRVLRKGQNTQGQQILKGGEGAGAGFEGKHFIEGAWQSYLETIGSNWKKALTRTAAEFGKK
jgi:hypothetical protein